MVYLYVSKERRGAVIRLSVLFLLIAFVVSCSNAPEPEVSFNEKEEKGTEATYFPAEDPDYRMCGNAKYNFWFDLPNRWKAVDKSAVGDGYFIECGSESADVRMYAMQREPPDDEFYKLLVEDRGEIKSFTFRDGREGRLVQKGNLRYFVRNADDVRIVFYVKVDERWYQEHEETIRYMARSVRMGKVE
jgi:hypothetical protein